MCIGGQDVHTPEHPGPREIQNCREKHRHTYLNTERLGDMYVRRLYVCVYVCVNECFYFWREREQEKDIQREEREKHTQLIPREEKDTHTQTTLCLSLPCLGEDTGGLRVRGRVMHIWKVEEAERWERETDSRMRREKRTHPEGRGRVTHQCTGGLGGEIH